jgi:hypothetical protein
MGEPMVLQHMDPLSRSIWNEYVEKVKNKFCILIFSHEFYFQTHSYHLQINLCKINKKLLVWENTKLLSPAVPVNKL